MKHALTILVLLLLTPLALLADGGVLIPRDKAQPDPSILSLEEMEITVQIDNGDARVFVKQIFANHTGGIEEGNYIFALPGRAIVSDFAVWDDVTRIPGVILERRRAEEPVPDADGSEMACMTEMAKAACQKLGGTCVIQQDGYYYAGILCVLLGISLLVCYVKPAILKVQNIPKHMWRLKAAEDEKSSL